MLRTFTAIIERCPATGLFVAHVPGIAGAHTQAETLDELGYNMKEVLELLFEQGEPRIESEFVGTQTVLVGVA